MVTSPPSLWVAREVVDDQGCVRPYNKGGHEKWSYRQTPTTPPWTFELPFRYDPESIARAETWEASSSSRSGYQPLVTSERKSQ